ncbi:MAG: type II secretion system protein [Planctomycetes bacterium]|nr:type II secretion system protein [Planctomycetota bacterium]
MKTTGTFLAPCHPPTRRGFTLVEMLAVIMIIGLLMSLVVGSFFRTRTVNQLLASEQVLSDAIRQARHTARSTGAPALLKLSPTRRPDGTLLGGIITGVSRVWVWSEFFDHGQALDVQGFTIGMSGTGRLVNQDAPWFPPELDRALRFRTGDGAYVAVAVRPPLAGQIGREIPKQIPLILVGTDNSAAGSSFGVMLVRSDAIDPRKAAIQSGGGKRAKMMCWEILGWVRLPKEPEPVYISSFDHLPSDLTRDRATLPSGNADISDPIGGDRWEEIGLLITNDQMTLYRNGRRVAELRAGKVVDGRAIELPKQLLPGDQIWVGQANLDGGMAYAKCPIDDARVYKLGASEFGSLPKGVYPMADPSQPAGTAVEYRVLAHPEGRIELSSAIGADTRSAQGAALNTDAALSTGTIFLGGDFTRTAPGGTTRGANSAQVTVAIDGRVHGSLVLVPEPKPERTPDTPAGNSGQ